MSNQEIPVVDLNVEKQLSQSEDNSVRVVNEVNLKANTNQLADSIENQSEIQRRSARARTLTEKGQAYQEQRQKEKEKEEDHLTKKFNKTYNTWEVYAAEVESFLASQLPSSQEEKIEKISNLDGLRNNVHMQGL